MRLPRWIENRLDFLAKESVYGRGLDTGVFIGRQHRENEIIKLLEMQLCGNPDCTKGYGHNTCQMWLQAIALIEKQENLETDLQENLIKEKK